MEENTGVTFTQRATFMSEDESKFAEVAFANASDASNSVELRGWRTIDPRKVIGANQLGSAGHPIEIDDDESHYTPGAGENGGVTAAGTGLRLKNHIIHEGDLSPGDQIYAYRGAVQHHGIVTFVPWARGANGVFRTAPHLPTNGVHVVHFDSGCDGVETTSLEAFLKGGILRRATYSASKWSASLDFGASYACPADDPATIVMRATEAAKFGQGTSGWSGYSLLTNNCETFAFWCCTGRRQTLSRQANRGLVGAGLVAAGVSAAATVGGLTATGATATARAATMVSRSVSVIDRTVRAVQWTAGVAAVTIAAADVVTQKATREPRPRGVATMGKY